ncbi:hypothetical protein AVEN_55597-1, partial [Araneus ventricosus]
AQSELADQETVVYPDQLESTSLALRFRLKPDVLHNGKVILKCVATINHIHAVTIKEIRATVHVDYLGNECADQLAKEAITKGNPFFLPKPLSYLKSEIKSAALSIWQDNWNNGETGRSTHDIVPRVSNKPVGWNGEELMFVTGHGPFP